MRKLIGSEEFKRSWREISECGVGSKEAVTTCFDLIAGSPFHGSTLLGSIEDIIDAVARLADRWEKQDGIVTLESIEEFAIEMSSTLQTTAAVYVVYGAMAGAGAMANVGHDRKAARALSRGRQAS